MINQSIKSRTGEYVIDAKRYSVIDFYRVGEGGMLSAPPGPDMLSQTLLLIGLKNKLGREAP